jgi:pyruvate/2-oxoglutarate/acetoin dehydrogenase E1 component
MMAEDERVIVLGEDILDPYGGAFKVTQGLSSQYPQRVWATPISEAAIIGIANGLALRGLRPVAEIMFGDFITLAADQLINHATKFAQMYNGQVSVPITIRTPMGGGRGYGPTHSQSLEKLYLGIPELHIVAPSRFHQPGHLLRQAVLGDDAPVLFIEHKLLYPAQLALPWQIQSSEISDSSGYPAIKVQNASSPADILIITYGGVSLHLPQILENLAQEEISAHAYLPASIHPLNLEPILPTAARCGRILIIEEGPGNFGWSAEAAVQLYDALGPSLKTPIRRLSALPTAIPAARHLEDQVIITPEKIEKTIWEVLFA